MNPLAVRLQKVLAGLAAADPWQVLCRLINGLLVLALLLALYTAWIWTWARSGVADKAQAQCVAKVEKATAREEDRRTIVLRGAQGRSATDVAWLKAEQARRDQLLTEIQNASAAHNGAACLDADSVRRLAAIGAPQGQGRAGD